MDQYEPYRDTMRRKHGYCGPYRLGIAIGEDGADLPNPYSKPASARQFEDGRRVGRHLRAREEAERNIRIAIWNAARDGGMQQDLAQALIQRAMNEPLIRRVIDAAGSAPG